MANIIEDINDALKTTLVGILPSEFKELPYVILVDLNDFRGTKKTYGVRPLTGDFTSGVTKNYTMDQTFEIILTRDYVNRGGTDLDQRTQQFFLLDQADKMLKEVLNTKAGIPNIILNVTGFSLLEPEFLLDDKVTVQRLQLTVKYRQALN